MLLTKLDKYRDIGLLLLRVGIGIMFMMHGYPKLIGGEEKWESLGNNMGNLGITFAPVFWGFMAAFAEFGGGILLALGLFFRPAAFLLFFTMFVAAIRHISAGDGFNGYSHAAESAILFFSLIFTGPGKYSLDEMLIKKNSV
jgi:putative oxidoreductase